MHAESKEPSPPTAEQRHPASPDLGRLLAEARHENAQHVARIGVLEKALDQLKSDFLNAASHELRTPLTSIKGYAELLEDQVGGRLTPQQRAYVIQIQAGARRLQMIVDDMLDLARLEAGMFQTQPLLIDLARVIAAEVAGLMPLARDKGVTLVIVPPPPLVGNFDPARIGQVLICLVDNAIKFTPPGGRVEISGDVLPQGLRIAVKDTGLGIPAELHPRIFEKFYQVNPTSTREAGGTGLGLAISKALIDAHGGTMGVTSALGDGSTFWFSLPTT